MTSSEGEKQETRIIRVDPMSQEKIPSHEPTAVNRDSNDQQIAEGGQTGTNTEEAKEKYRKEDMTKV